MKQIGLLADPATKTINGFWLPPEVQHFSDTPERLEIFVIQEKFPDGVYPWIASRDYRVVPNKANKDGGVYVVFGKEKAPGESSSSSVEPRPSFWRRLFG